MCMYSCKKMCIPCQHNRSYIGCKFSYITNDVFGITGNACMYMVIQGTTTREEFISEKFRKRNLISDLIVCTQNQWVHPSCLALPRLFFATRWISLILRDPTGWNNSLCSWIITSCCTCLSPAFEPTSRYLIDQIIVSYSHEGSNNRTKRNQSGMSMSASVKQKVRFTVTMASLFNTIMCRSGFDFDKCSNNNELWVLDQ